MTLPIFALNVQWDGISWTDEIARVIAFNVRMGRDSELSVTQAGRLTVTLRNEDGRYTPEYTSGPLYGLLEPLRAIHLSASFGGNTYGLFAGYITAIQPKPQERRCTIEAQDAFIHFANFHLNLPLADNKLSSDRIADILATVGYTQADIATGQSLFEYSYWRNSDALTALQEVAENELGGLVYMRPGPAPGPATCVFQDRHYRPKQLTVATLDKTAEVNYQRRDNQVYNSAHLQCTAYIVGPAQSQIWSLVPLPQAVAAGATLELQINYPTLCKDVLTPVPSTDLVANSQPDGSGLDLTASITTVSFDNYGGGATWILRNDALVPAYLLKCQIRGTPLQQPSELRTVSRSASGGVSAFPRDYSRTFRLLSDRQLLGDFAQYIVTRYKTPQPVITVRLLPISDVQLTHMLARTISDRITVIDTADPWRTQVSGDFFIEQIEHTWQQEEAILNTTWVLTGFLADQFWLLGTSALGTDTVLGY